MSKSKLTKTIDYLSDPKKGITAAVLLVLVIVAAVLVWRKLKGKWNGSSALTALNDAAIEAGTGSSITQSLDFALMCNRLMTASYWVGTNEDEIYSVLGMLNTQADYMKLSKAWAQKWSSSGWAVRNVMYQSSTLAGLLRSELNSSELEHAREILRAKGITPDF